MNMDTKVYHDAICTTAALNKNTNLIANLGLVSGFTPVNASLAIIRVQRKFFNIIPICAYAPSKGKDKAVNYVFYIKLKEVCDKYPPHDAKIVLG